MENHIESEMTLGDKVKTWLEDNLRILLSILIVIAIAGGIYSYSQRTQSPTITTEDAEEIASETETIESIGSESAQEGAQTEEGQQTAQPAQGEQATSTETSRETETSFVEVAQSGNGTTHLARRALANYLEKNPDSALTKEHKIYIEDYLRKNVRQTGSLTVGSSVEFSKGAIGAAIEKSKQLNDAQLKNLQKYSARVSSL
jgi:hypothetical protein